MKCQKKYCEEVVLVGLKMDSDIVVEDVGTRTIKFWQYIN
jgi:hypothetical protein